MSNPAVHTFTLSAADRLDKAIVTHVPDLSRTHVQRLIETGQVWVDEAPALKANTRVEAGTQVRVLVPPPAPATLAAEPIPLAVIYEDGAVLVINKPAGMVVHPAAGHARGTLVNAVLAHDPDLEGVGDEQRPGLVHRLDKDTSGLIVLAKTDQAQHALQRQFKERSVVKTYLALVDGAPPTPSGRIEAPIGRDPRERKRMAVVPLAQGREAVTEYWTQERFAAHTLLRVNLLTGRTHQIRVHLAYLKCPIVADTVYGRKTPTLPLTRQFLHAARLEFTVPGTRRRQVCEAPLPDELQAVLDGLRGSLSPFERQPHRSQQ